MILCFSTLWPSRTRRRVTLHTIIILVKHCTPNTFSSARTRHIYDQHIGIPS